MHSALLRRMMAWTSAASLALAATVLALTWWAIGVNRASERELTRAVDALHAFELSGANGRAAFWRLTAEPSTATAQPFAAALKRRDALAMQVAERARALGLEQERDALLRAQAQLNAASAPSWAALRAGRYDEAAALAKSPAFASAQRARYQAVDHLQARILAQLERRHGDARGVLAGSVALALAALLAMAFLWRRLFALNAAQRQALERAHAALAAHAGTLEARVAVRTAELSAMRDAAEAANVAKSRFLAVMSHEIRTPLNGVLGMVQALARTPLTPAQQRMLGVIEESGDLLLAVINDTLDMSKIEAGQMALEEADFDLAALIRSAAALTLPRAEAKDLRLDVSIAPEAEAWVRGDPTRLRQIVLNLLGNAVKFTPAGRVGLDVRLERRPGGVRELVVRVRDTGVGMDEAALARAFAPFQQADASTTRRFGGSGLGLTIARSLARMMGGDLTARSAPGDGSCFTLTARLAAGEAPAAQPAPRAEQVCQSEHGLRILAAEDNANNRAVLRLMLEAAGLDADFAEDGAEALAAWRGRRYDLILMDMEMPTLNGLDAARAIRQAEAAEGRPATPILALSANAMTHHVAEALAAGMDGHVAKPIHAPSLFAAMQQALNPPAAPQARAA